jgi:TolB-like protein/Flp pilus assembly protein TadD
MADERVQRRLAAILAADVAGYSRLMGADEEGTLAALKAHRRELIDPAIAAHNGRIVKTTGDGALVEFASVVDAVRCAEEIQCSMAERNSNVPEDRQIAFRVGVNVGDIIIDGDDIYGDGVNVAARLEALAEPGGVCISRAARDQVRDKLELSLEDMGEQSVKNIARPVRVFRIVVGSEANTISAEMPAHPPLPDKASIAVLAFQNMSGDADQEYFADGIVEDIITALSRCNWFFVIARNSSFTYKGRNVDVRTVGRELGVRYVLEGSVRRGGDRLRITAQLIEAASGNHIWADRYEGARKDVFDLQDRITEGVVGAVEPSVRQAEIERARRKPPDNLDAYDLYLRAFSIFHSEKFMSLSGVSELQALLRQAVNLDPNYGAAYGLAAWSYAWKQSQGWTLTSLEVAEAERLARSAADAGREDPTALHMAGHTLSRVLRRHDEGAALIRRALTINPNSANAWHVSGWVQTYLCDLDTAIDHFSRAMRLSPLDPLMFIMKAGMAWAYFVGGNYDEADNWSDQALLERPNYGAALRAKVASCSMSGREEEARAALNKLYEISPGTTVKSLVNAYPVTQSDQVERIAEAFRKVGVPEG